MQNNYWKKDPTRQEIITKMQIPNKENFNLFANYYNLIDKKGIGFQLSKDFDLPNEKLFRKTGFEYFILQYNNKKELFILPNNKIVDYTNRIVSKIHECRSENEVFNLLVNEMN
jgi:hypothetical protein